MSFRIGAQLLVLLGLFPILGCEDAELSVDRGGGSEMRYAGLLLSGLLWIRMSAFSGLDRCKVN